MLEGRFEGGAVGHIIDAIDDNLQKLKNQSSSLAPSVRH
jgi:hypothetical protein